MATPALEARLIKKVQKKVALHSEGKKQRDPNKPPSPLLDPKNRFDRTGIGNNTTGKSSGPRLLTEAYKAWLSIEDENGVTNAMHVAEAVGTRILKMFDLNAAIELREATEGRSNQPVTVIPGLEDAKNRLARFLTAPDAGGSETAVVQQPDERGSGSA